MLIIDPKAVNHGKDKRRNPAIFSVHIDPTSTRLATGGEGKLTHSMFTWQTTLSVSGAHKPFLHQNQLKQHSCLNYHHTMVFLKTIFLWLIQRRCSLCAMVKQKRTIISFQFRWQDNSDMDIVKVSFIKLKILFKNELWRKSEWWRKFGDLEAL